MLGGGESKVKGMAAIMFILCRLLFLMSNV